MVLKILSQLPLGELLFSLPRVHEYKFNTTYDQNLKASVTPKRLWMKREADLR